MNARKRAVDICGVHNRVGGNFTVCSFVLLFLPLCRLARRACSDFLNDLTLSAGSPGAVCPGPQQTHTGGEAFPLSRKTRSLASFNEPVYLPEWPTIGRAASGS